MAARRLTAALTANIEAAMLQERPDIARMQIMEMQKNTPVEGLTVYRRNGVEAFTDTATLMQVAEGGGPAEGRHGEHREDGAAGGAADDRAALPAGRRHAPDPGVHRQRQRADALHVAPARRQPGAVPGLPRHRPQGPGRRARGDVHGARAGGRARPAQPADAGGGPDHLRRRRRPRDGHAARCGPPHPGAGSKRPTRSARGTSPCARARRRATSWRGWARPSTT